MINRGPEDDELSIEYSKRLGRSRGRYPELSAMWNIPVTEEGILLGRQKRYEFFEQENDSRLVDLLFRATNSDLREL